MYRNWLFLLQLAPGAPVELELVELCKFLVLNLKGKGEKKKRNNANLGFDQSIMNFFKQNRAKHSLVENSILFTQNRQLQ